jgi:hypothetical protein
LIKELSPGDNDGVIIASSDKDEKVAELGTKNSILYLYMHTCYF